MKYRKKKNNKLKTEKTSTPDLISNSEELVVGECEQKNKPIRRAFKGPNNVSVLLRVNFEKEAFGEIIQHAKESLDAEICGVLVGQVCKDDEGLFVTVEAAIRGKAALGKKTHVTFTQETWNSIHSEKDRKYSKLKIIGWYHSHPGFGVELSEMDRFVHKNFFPSDEQIGLITDPLSGEVAVFVNNNQEVLNIDRIWVNGREHKCHIPHGTNSTKSENGMESLILSEKIEELNVRLSQVIQALDEQRTLFYRFLSTTFIIVCLGVVVLVSYNIYSAIFSKNEPPEVRSYVPIPVQIGDKTVLMGVGIVNWEVPPELNSTYLQIEQMKREAAEKETAESAEKQTNEQEDDDKVKERQNDSKEE